MCRYQLSHQVILAIPAIVYSYRPILNIKQPIQNIRDSGKPGKVVRKHEPTTDNQIGQYSQEGTHKLKYFWKQNSIINNDKQVIYAMAKSILNKQAFNHDSDVEYNLSHQRTVRHALIKLIPQLETKVSFEIKFSLTSGKRLT